MLTALIIANISVLAGSLFSHGAIWYRIGKLEKTVYNGGKKCIKHT